MGDWIFYLGIAAAFVTLGIGGFGTGKMSPQRQNRMMVYRIVGQATAVVLLFIAFAVMGD